MNAAIFFLAFRFGLVAVCAPFHRKILTRSHPFEEGSMESLRRKWKVQPNRVRMSEKILTQNMCFFKMRRRDISVAVDINT